MDIKKEALRLHEQWRGKLEINSTIDIKDGKDLSYAYTPGVAEPCLEIAKNISKSYELTRRWNLVAVVSDGSAVLGLGDIGPEASMPVMEGKCVLFKTFAGVDAFPICLNTKDSDKIVEVVKLMEPTFGGINLEDISAPRCFEIEEKLKKTCEIPIFHDDQHGTAIVCLAALINALKIANKNIIDVKITINGAGAAAIAIGKLLKSIGVQNIIMCDSKGIIHKDRIEGMNKYKELFISTNIENVKGTLKDAILGADVFIGVSIPDVVDQDMVKSMAVNPIIFAMSNPTPEIMPSLAKDAGALVVGTGRSDFPNQINNVLAFPGIFRGALDVLATEITEGMKLAAAYAIANIILEEELTPEYVIPGVFDKRVAPSVASSVAKAAMKEGVARLEKNPEEIYRDTESLID